MKGYIYISGAMNYFHTKGCGNRVGRVGCGVKKNQDFDPHLLTKPYTWGICRPDLRPAVNPGDYVFFVTPKKSQPQMIYCYLKVKEKITHSEAFARPELEKKRMTKNSGGNIIVDSQGKYNKYDGGRHKDRFARIKEHYVIADMNSSEVLSEGKKTMLAPKFLEKLNQVLGKNNGSIFEAISRKGRRLKDTQVENLLEWLR